MNAEHRLWRIHWLAERATQWPPSRLPIILRQIAKLSA